MNIETVARNVIDFLFVSYLIYRALLLIRGTRAVHMLSGLAVIVALYFVAQHFGLLTLGWILEYFLGSIIFITVVIFQDEIRRGLTKVGLHRFFRLNRSGLFDKTIEDLTLVCTSLSRAKTGALIVIQREVGLDEFLEDGVAIDALMNRKLLYSLFVKDSPLHDGAVLIEGERIKAASCVLPLSFNPDLDPNLGTRHRAALGLSERSDALVLIVSEETGAMSLAHDGRLARNLDGSMLRDLLHKLLSKKVLVEEEQEEEAAA